MKKLALTMGDPAGVGPELCLKVAELYRERDVELVIYGNLRILERVAKQLGLVTEPFSIKDHPVENVAEISPGKVQANCGQAAYDFLLSAISDCTAGKIDGIVTCPLNKAALEAAGVGYPGHTEILVEETNTSTHAMMLAGGDLSCSLVTTHIGLSAVPNSLTVERIIEVTQLTAQLVKKKLGKPPKLAILGLNPHAGEGGLFGNQEEEKIIQPAIAELMREGVEVIGPLPPDTAFLPKIREEVDAHICMYHDQGLIPLKTLYFDEGVNVTLGLPIIRTSVDHGTAFDIAWQGKAETKSLQAAINYACKLIN